MSNTYSISLKKFNKLFQIIFRIKRILKSKTTGCKILQTNIFWTAIECYDELTCEEVWLQKLTHPTVQQGHLWGGLASKIYPPYWSTRASKTCWQFIYNLLVYTLYIIRSTFYCTHCTSLLFGRCECGWIRLHHTSSHF